MPSGSGLRTSERLGGFLSLADAYPELWDRALDRALAWGRPLGASSADLKRFSALWGSERHAHMTTEHLTAVSGQTQTHRLRPVEPDFRLEGVHRYWSQTPQPSGQDAAGRLLRSAIDVPRTAAGAASATVPRPNAASADVLSASAPWHGHLTVQIAPILNPRLRASFPYTPVSARLSSSLRAGMSPAAWQAGVTGLAQDLYLRALIDSIPQTELRNPDARYIRWPTINAESTMVFEHGLGVPVMAVNGQRIAVGLTDALEGRFLLIETSLFLDSLVRLCDPDAAWDAATCDAVLTPVLSDWIVSMRATLRAAASSAVAHAHDALALLDSTGGLDGLSQLYALVFQHAQRSGCPPTDATHVGQQLRQELSALKAIRPETLSFTDADRWFAACPQFLRFLDGLSRLQDRIRYEQGGRTHLPPGGQERAWLNTQLRHLFCADLRMHRPAEMAQFDLLLRAVRSHSNAGFNDDSVSLELVRHHEWVAASEDGHDSRLCRVLAQSTRLVPEMRDAHLDEPCIFWLDEHSSATAHSWP